eukprot:618141-Alexandrium_andersonii.AAC.1
MVPPRCQVDSGAPQRWAPCSTRPCRRRAARPLPLLAHLSSPAPPPKPPPPGASGGRRGGAAQ